MYKIKFPSLLAAAIGLIAAATPAFAWHGHVTRVEGPLGRGYVHSRSVSRAPGSVSVNRDTQTNRGYGMATSRQANWATEATTAAPRTRSTTARRSAALPA